MRNLVFQVLVIALAGRSSTASQLRDRTIEFECRLEGDLWYHEARLDAGGRHYDVREVWKRLASGES